MSTDADPLHVDKAWLDAALLEAHGRDDLSALVDLYEQAGLAEQERGDVDAACFYFTHAYVFALEVGLPEAASIKSRLVAYRRDS